MIHSDVSLVLSSHDLSVEGLSESITEMTGYPLSFFKDSRFQLAQILDKSDNSRFLIELRSFVKSDEKSRGFEDIKIQTKNRSISYIKVHAVKKKDTIELEMRDVSRFYGIDYPIGRLMKTLKEALWDWDLMTQTIRFSHQWTIMLGNEAEELVKDLKSWEEEIHPDDLDSLRKSREDFISGSAETYELTYRIRKQDSSYFWVLDRGFLERDEQGRAMRMIGSCRDITEEKEIRDNLERMIITDELTGLYNRRFYNLQIHEEILRAERYGNDLSILMIDIDLFKQINDTYGHRAGDLALRDLSKLIKDKIRNTDSAYRTGGEEFVIIAPETNQSNALIAAERLREAVADIEIETEYGNFSFTISIGIGTFAKGDSEGTLNERADVALYKSKESGRNRTSF